MLAVMVASGHRTAGSGSEPRHSNSRGHQVVEVYQPSHGHASSQGSCAGLMTTGSMSMRRSVPTRSATNSPTPVAGIMRARACSEAFCSHSSVSIWAGHRAITLMPWFRPTGFIFGPTLTAVLVWVGGIRAPFAVFAGAMLLFLPVAMRLPPDRGLLDLARRPTSFDLLSNRRLQGALIIVGGYFMIIGAWEAVLPVMFADRGAGAGMTGIAFTVVALPVMLVGTRAGSRAWR